MIVASKEGYESWLIRNGYSEWTFAGNPSTTHHYAYWVERVMKQENLDGWCELAEKIQDIIHKFGKFGIMKKFGNKGHSTVINALQRFLEYLITEHGFEVERRVYFI